MRVRLVMNENGAVHVDVAPVPPPSQEPMRFVVSGQRISRTNPFVFHKTTNRAFYDDERTRQQRRTGCDEVVFLNDDGEITEGSITNIFIERDGKLLTPPVSCGLLNGTLRQDLIDQGRAVEMVLEPEDIKHTDRIWLGNSVRGVSVADMM
jgi:para-aminobenzoate synthetase/4-amino-4-deoxychorismate lyase